MNSNRDVQTALLHHQAGRLDLAENIYRKVLASDPNHSDALHLMGAIAGQRGRFEEGIELLQKAISVQPNYFQAIRNLAALLAQAGRYEDSVSMFRKAIELVPEDAALHNDLGTVLERLDRTDEAIAMFTTAAELDPIFADALKNLCHALRKNGMAAEAVEAGSKAITIAPSSADARFELGKALVAARRPQDALQEFREAIRCKPDYMAAFEEIGKTFAQMQKFDEAVAVMQRAIELQPDQAGLHIILGSILGGAERHLDALLQFREAVRIKPDSLEAHVNAAIALAKLKRFEEALEHHIRAAAIDANAAITHEAAAEIAMGQLDAKTAVEHYRDACAADPTLVSSLTGLGLALRSSGKFDEAQAAFRKALQLDPSLVSIYDNMVRTGMRLFADSEIEQLTRVLKEAEAEAEEQVAAEFALGKILDEKERFDEAFQHYAIGNLMQRKRREARGNYYDPGKYREMVDQMIETLTPAYFAERRGWGDPSELPVFIVGMPRSGTTLAHQIVASHPQVHGGGERGDMRKIAGFLGGGDLREAALSWKKSPVAEAALKQIQEYRKIAPSAARFVDKMPNNVVFCAIIALLFPQARIIFCRRDPRDTCLSCYFQNFPDGLPFATDLTHCGLHNVETYRLMDHWLQALPLRMMELHYESVVDDLEGQARRLIDFLGLPWDPACLEFQKAKTAVLTCSVWQVRQPIYNSSVGRWRKYESHLGPLLKALETLPKDGLTAD